MHSEKILIVEDERIIALHTKNCLLKQGYEVIGLLSSGEEVLEFIRHTLPDLILMDIQLRGEMDGVETSQRILMTENIPIIYLTAFADDHTLQRAKINAPFGYILKPFDERELLIQIEIALYKHKLEAALRESEERYMLSVQGSNDGMWDWDLRSEKVFFSPRWKAMLGYQENEIADNPQEWFDRIHPDDLPAFQQIMFSHLDHHTPHFECEYRMRHKQGEYIWMLTRGLAMRDAHDRAFRLSGSQTDITQRKQAEEQLKYNAFHDSLTNLPNRALLLDRIAHAIELYKRNPHSLFAVLYLDLDQFKIVNDSLGHQAGDQLLTQVSKRLQQLVRGGDTVARLGGDEFAILLENVDDPTQIKSITERILTELRRPFVNKKRQLFISGSIGVVVGDNGYKYPEEIIRDADIAMYQAKNQGRFGYAFFDHQLRSQLIVRHEMETMLRGAIERKEFKLNYQPIFALESGEISGFEALLRWHPHGHEPIPPDVFVPVAEETGLMVVIGKWVIREACHQMVKWQTSANLNPAITMNINISGKQFINSRLCADITEILKETGLSAKNLKLEITENMFFEHAEFSDQALEKLAKIGIQLQIDDFGSGYCSLGFLERHPINTIKLDRSFINKINAKDRRDIAGSIIKMALDLGMEIVAEGIESEEQLTQLKNFHCQYGQGFLLSRPAEPEVIEQMLMHEEEVTLPPELSVAWVTKEERV